MLETTFLVEYAGRELRMVRTVWIVLGLKTHARMLGIGHITLPYFLCFQKVACINLYSGHSCTDLHRTAADRLMHRCKLNHFFRIAGENETMIVPSGLLDVPTHTLFLGEIENRSLNIDNISGWN